MRIRRIVLSVESFDPSAPQPSGNSQVHIALWDGDLIASQYHQNLGEHGDQWADDLANWIANLLTWELAGLEYPALPKVARRAISSRPRPPQGDWTPDRDLPA